MNDKEFLVRDLVALKLSLEGLAAERQAHIALTKEPWSRGYDQGAAQAIKSVIEQLDRILKSHS